MKYTLDSWDLNFQIHLHVRFLFILHLYRTFLDQTLSNLRKTNFSFLNGVKRSFTNYVYKIWLFFYHLLPSVYIFYGIKVYKTSIFLTTYPPPLVNVVYEPPLIKICIFSFLDQCAVKTQQWAAESLKSELTPPHSFHAVSPSPSEFVDSKIFSISFGIFSFFTSSHQTKQALLSSSTSSS